MKSQKPSCKRQRKTRQPSIQPKLANGLFLDVTQFATPVLALRGKGWPIKLTAGTSAKVDRCPVCHQPCGRIEDEWVPSEDQPGHETRTVRFIHSMRSRPIVVNKKVTWDQLGCSAKQTRKRTNRAPVVRRILDA